MIKLQWSETALEFLHEDIPGAADMVPVFSISNSENDWSRLLALFSPATNKFHWLSRAGCTCCEELTDSIKSVSDLTVGTERDLKQAVRAFVETTPGVLKDGELQKIFSKIKKQTTN